MENHNVEDFTRCPDCNTIGVALDYYFNGEYLFLMFSCQECDYSAMEDDIRFWVRCPECHDETPSYGGVDTVEGDVDEDGLVRFRCTDCGSEAERQIRTRWDADESDVQFEPNIY